MKVSDIKILSLDKGNRHLKNKISPGPVDKEELRLREASKKLEGQFLSLLIKSMENTIPKDDKSKQSLATMMFSTVMGDAMSNNGGIGLADLIYKSLKEQGSDALNKMSEMGGYNPFYAPILTGGTDD